MARSSSLHWVAVGATVVALTVAPSLDSRAQTSDKVLHVGILSSGDVSNRSPLDQALVDGLRERGYVEGRNLVIVRRYDSRTLKENAAELAGLKLDAIVTTCTPSTRLMKEATASTPIVMAAVSDPVRQHIIASLAKPGENVTGTTSQAEELLTKRVELINMLVPGAGPIAVLANKGNPVHTLGWERLEAVAPGMNVRLIKLDVARLADMPGAVEAAAQAGARALLVLPDDPLMFNSRPQLVPLAAKYRIPDFYWAREYVDIGGLLSYGESLSGSYRAAASYIDRIKKGANPGLLPVEQPTRFELVINLKTAKALGLTVPQAVLVRADAVVQ